MKSTPVIRLSPEQYRVHRFPPLATSPAPTPNAEIDGLNQRVSSVDIQQQLEDGFQQGLTKGHEEGLAQGQQQGFQQGLANGEKQGFQQGFQQGEQAGRQLFEQAATPVRHIFMQLEQWQSEQEQQQRHMICELVQKVAQQVIRAELTLMPQQILALVNETLEAMPGDNEQVTIYVNPQDLERIKQVSPELPSAWLLVEKPELAVGSCHLVTNDAEADASCDSRLDVCMESVKSHLLTDQPDLAQSVESFEPPLAAALSAESVEELSGV